jgi:hypothetical protein
MFLFIALLSLFHLYEEMLFAGLIALLFALKLDLFSLPFSEFSLEFPFADLHLLLLSLVIHFLNNCVSHLIHEHLLALFSCLDLSHAIGFLLLHYRCMQLLGFDILKSLSLNCFQGFLF